MSILMDPDTPNFFWKNIDASMDMDCIIESEIPEISPAERIEAISVVGRNGELHESFGDYAAYDLTIPKITIPYERLQEVKTWLRGRGQLVTHNDSDKYRDCICSMGKEKEFENEIGVFYIFSVTFRCQPFRRKLNDRPIPFNKGILNFTDPGNEVANPYLEIEATGGDFTLTIGDRSLKVLNASAGKVSIDTELGKILQGTKNLFSIGEWPEISPGDNQLITSGAMKQGFIQRRSLFL